MRCPKCSYLSCDDVERCRNCGHDFSLVPLPRKPEAPADDVTVSRETRAWEPTPRRGRLSSIDTTPLAEGAALDLPLFEDRQWPELPPVVIPPAGPPLSVRRKLDAPRPTPRPEPRIEAPTGAGPPPGFEWPDEPAIVPSGGGDEGVSAVDAAGEHRGGLGARLAAGAIDAALLLTIDLVVLWLTLRVAGLTLAEWRVLRLVPLGGFLFLLDTAYLVTFTAASGQSIGKMLAGVRVVDQSEGRVPFGHAVLRSVVLLLCALPFGLGLLPLLFDAEARGPHDRLAGTRVIPSA
ncbi:MAG: RDD family protein [Luteitalea sp.]